MKTRRKDHKTFDLILPKEEHYNPTNGSFGTFVLGNKIIYEMEVVKYVVEVVQTGLKNSQDDIPS